MNEGAAGRGGAATAGTDPAWRTSSGGAEVIRAGRSLPGEPGMTGGRLGAGAAAGAARSAGVLKAGNDVNGAGSSAGVACRRGNGEPKPGVGCSDAPAP